MDNQANKVKKSREEFIAQRREAREQCFAVLFEMTFNTDESYEEILDKAVESRLIVASDYTIKLLKYYSENSEAVDNVIKENVKGWSFGRISHVSLSVLRMAISELQCTKTPKSVVINEAVELTKKYAEPKESRFVNGVLGAAVSTKKDEGNEQ